MMQKHYQGALPARNLVALTLTLALSLGTAAATAQTPEPPPPVSLEVKSFKVDGDNPLGAEETQRLLQPFLGRHVGLEGLQSAADALEQAIRARGNAFHRVVLPPQETQGDVRLSVVVFRISGVDIKGEQHYAKETVLASLPSLKAGEVPDNTNLAREIALANEHPTRQIAVFMRESEVPDHLQAEVRVNDQKPRSFFTSLNNTGPGGPTGRWRLSAGVQFSNLFDADHALTASYSTSPEATSKVKQWGLFYRLPLYAQHSALSFYVNDSNVRSGGFANGPFESNGQGRFYGARLTHKLKAVGDWGQQIEVGVDDKLFVSRLNGIAVTPDVRSRPLSVRYEGQHLAPGFTLRAGIEAVMSLDGGSGNDAATYAAQPTVSEHHWSLWRANVEVGKDLFEGWNLSGKLKVQESRRSLLSGEQFGLGGVQSIRGFEEREVSGDRGWQGNLELNSPLYFESLRWQVFYDQGVVVLNQANGRVPKETAASLGVGLQWQLAKSAQLSADIATVIDPVEGSTATSRKGFGKFHLGLTAAF